MSQYPIVLKYLYNPGRMVGQVVSALCLCEFERLRGFATSLPNEALYQKIKDGRLHCLVPGWAKEWYGRVDRSWPVDYGGVLSSGFRMLERNEWKMK
ncbi:MAG: hypothetical protein QME75_16095 [Deltaproteobacteria bacterium]|nr:hypothetical protein [Deltaproteobacteria bacterium]